MVKEVKNIYLEESLYFQVVVIWMKTEAEEVGNGPNKNTCTNFK